MPTSLPLVGVRTPTKHVYYSMTKALCSECKTSVDGKIQFVPSASARGGGIVVLDKFCPSHGKQSVEIASSIEWYLDALSFVAPNEPPARTATKVDRGCPHDCGPCASHQQKVYLPVVPITSACNLDCPICYTVNKNEGAFEMTSEHFGHILAHLKRDHAELDIINFTGGEPTLNPHLPKLLEMCRDAGIRRLTISTNGLKLLDESYLQVLAALDARVILSLDTFDPKIDQALLGADTTRAKLRVVDLLEKHGVTGTILPAVAAGLNDRDIPALLQLVLSKPNLCSLELHTLTFTGQGGVGFDRKARISIPDLHAALESASEGKIGWRDFVPSPLAHPHCYSICYLLMLDDGGYVPFTRFMSRGKLFELLQDSLYIEPREQVEAALRDCMDELFADPEKIPEGERILATLKRLVREMFPTGERALSIDARRKIAERASKAIYIHSHMDEESFDVSRIMKCSVGVPEVDGTNIPTCAYNVLYREKDPRFSDARTVQKIEASRPGKVSLPILAFDPGKPGQNRSGSHGTST